MIDKEAFWPAKLMTLAKSKGLLGGARPFAKPKKPATGVMAAKAMMPRTPGIPTTPKVGPPKRAFIEGFKHELNKVAKVTRKGISTRGEFDDPFWAVVGALDALYRHKGKVLLGAGAGAAGAYGASKLLKKKKDEK